LPFSTVDEKDRRTLSRQMPNESVAPIPPTFEDEAAWELEDGTVSRGPITAQNYGLRFAWESAAG